MAIRWSPCGSISAPCSFPARRPSTFNPSGRSSTVAPIRRKIFRQRGDAVALFHAQFRRVANLDSLFRVRPQRREHGQLVDHQRNHARLRSRRPSATRPSRQGLRRFLRGSSSAKASESKRPFPRKNPGLPCALDSSPRCESRCSNPASSDAAAMKNTAEERSPGTSRDRAD